MRSSLAVIVKLAERLGGQLDGAGEAGSMVSPWVQAFKDRAAEREIKAVMDLRGIFWAPRGPELSWVVEGDTIIHLERAMLEVLVEQYLAEDKPPWGERLLHLLAAVGNDALIKRMRSAGSLPSDDAMYVAAMRGNLAALGELLDAATRKQPLVGTNKQVLLEVIRWSGKVDLVQRLLALGADPNAVDEYGDHALLLAASTDRPDLIGPLIDAGADIEHQNRSGATALIGASAFGHVRFVRELLKHGSNVNARMRDKRTALIAAVALWGATEELVRMLLDAGADLALRDKHGETAQSTAKQEGHAQLAALLAPPAR